MKNKIILFIFFVLLFIFIPKTHAEDIKFYVEVDNNQVQLGDAIELTLKVTGTQDIDPLRISELEGFTVSYAGGPVKQYSWVNGKSMSSVSYKYSLFPSNTGDFVIPAFEIKISGNVYRSKPISIKVYDSAVSGASPNSNAGKNSINNKIFLVLDSQRKEVFLNEKMSVRIFLFVSDLRVEVGESPEINSAGISVERYKKAKQYPRVINGVRFNVIEFEAIISPTRLGDLTLGPAKVGCFIVVKNKRSSFGGRQSLFDSSFFDSFFDNYERIPKTLHSNKLTLKVLEVPQQGKPENFSNAVGEFDFNVSVGPKEVSVGDPITLKMEIKGDGNLDVVTFPEIAENEELKLYEPIINFEEGRKSLEQIIIPRSEKVEEIPIVRFSYFDVNTKQYKIIEKGPFPVEVSALSDGEDFKVIGLNEREQFFQTESIGQDIVFIKDDLGRTYFDGQYLYNHFVLSLTPFILLIVWAGFIFHYKWRHKLQTDIVYARRLRAPLFAKKGLKQSLALMENHEPQAFYNVLFKTFQQYLGNKFHLSSGAVTSQIISQYVESKIKNKNIVASIKKLFEECDLIRFSSARIEEKNMKESYTRLEEIIDYMERHIR